MREYRDIRVRGTRATIIILLLAVAFLISSRTTGSGWLTIMVSLLAATLVWAFVRPVWILARVKVSIEAAADAMVGRSTDLNLAVTGPHCDLRASILDLDSEIAWIAAPQEGTMVVRPPARGVVTSLAVLIETASGLGLAWARRTVTVPLDRPMEVAPRPTTAVLPRSATTSGEGESAVGGRHNDGETVRAVREYRLGDPVRMIHWGVTARRGQLVVKELESPQSPSLIVSLDLRGPLGEEHASLAAGYVAAGLRSGLPVILHTYEPTGPHTAGVGSTLEAGRRLARAIPGALPPVHTPDRSSVVRLGPSGT